MRRGALLLEVLLSLSLFVMASIAILSVIGDALSRLEQTRERLEASDLAHSAMAALDSGLYEVSALNGPVPEGGLFADDDLDSGGVSRAPEGGDIWALDIESEPSEFDGLSLVTVSVLREPGIDGGGALNNGFDDRIGGVLGSAPVFTLRQLVADRESARGALDASGVGATPRSSPTGGFRSRGGGP